MCLVEGLKWVWDGLDPILGVFGWRSRGLGSSLKVIFSLGAGWPGSSKSSGLGLRVSEHERAEAKRGRQLGGDSKRAEAERGRAQAAARGRARASRGLARLAAAARGRAGGTWMAARGQAQAAHGPSACDTGRRHVCRVRPEREEEGGHSD